MGPAGARRDEVRRPRGLPVVPRHPAARAARDDRRPEGQAARHERDRERDPALARRPAERSDDARAEAPRAGREGAARRHRTADPPRGSGDLLTPVTVRDDASGPMVSYLYEHSSQFPGVTIGRSLRPALPVPGARRAAARLRRRRSRSGAPTARQALRPERRRSGSRASSRPTTATCEASTASSASTSTRSAARSARADRDAAEAGQQRAADARPEAAEGGGEARSQYGIRLAQSDGHWAAAAARSSRSTRTTARSSRWRRRRRTSRRSTPGA